MEITELELAASASPWPLGQAWGFANPGAATGRQIIDCVMQKLPVTNIALG